MRGLVFVLFAACGGSTAAEPPATAPTSGSADAVEQGPPPLEKNLPVLATRATQIYQSVAKLLGASSDCASATQQMTALQTANADVVAANRTVLREGRAKELRAALEAHATELDAAAKEIIAAPLMQSCSNDKAFTDAFDSLVGAPP